MDSDKKVCLYKAPGNARRIQFTELADAIRNQRFPVYMIDDDVPCHSLYVFVVAQESPVQGHWLFKKYYALRFGGTISSFDEVVGFSHNTDEARVKEDFDSCIRAFALDEARSTKAKLIDETQRSDEGYLAQIASEKPSF